MVCIEGGRMNPLHYITGPDCPNCGVNGVPLVEAGMAPAAWARFRCDFCHHLFTIGRPPADGPTVNGVPYNRTRCVCPNPRCRAENPPVTSSRGIYRWHKCSRCGQTFESVELQPRP